MNYQKYGLFVLSAFLVVLLGACASSSSTAGDSAQSAVASAEEQVVRAMHDWDTGKSIAYKVVRSQKQVLEIPGQGVQEQESSATMDISLTSAGSRTFDLAVTDAEFVGSQLSPDAVVGLESTLSLDGQGRITSATGLDENSFVIAQGGTPSFIADLQELFLVLPDEPLAQGVSWTEESSFDFAQSGVSGTRSATEKYTCKGVTTYNGVEAFQVDVTSDVSMIGNGNQGGGEMDVTLEGSIVGRIYVDTSTGSLLSSEQSGSIDGGIEMAMGYLPMSIEISITTDVAE